MARWLTAEDMLLHVRGYDAVLYVRCEIAGRPSLRARESDSTPADAELINMAAGEFHCISKRG